MQKTLIALAVAGLLSSQAYAETYVKIGGKYDASYQFTNAANADNSDGTSTGGTTKETLGDGGASTSRITIFAKEDLAPGWAAIVDLDLRFGTIEEGKTGISSNDKKALYLTSPYGNLRWGVLNLAPQNFVDFEEKPYMVNIKDIDIVKFGLSQKRDSYLTNRVTEYDTPILALGQFKARMKGAYAIGTNRKSGTSNTDGKNSGDVYAVQTTGGYGKWVNWGISSSHRTAASQVATATTGGMHWSENYINFHPVENLKVGIQYNVYKGYGADGTGTAGLFKEKDTNFVVAYNFGQKVQVGVSRSHLNDLGDNRNSGKAWMVGGSYFVTPSTYVYLAFEKDDYQRNETGISGGYSGTSDNFVGSFDKVDKKYTTFGLVKEF